MPKKKEWMLILDNWLGGLAPGYWKLSHPFFGNKNQAAAITDVEIWDDFGFLAQGRNLTAYTNSADVTTQIKGFSKTMSSSGSFIYAVGGAKFYEISGAGITITSDSDFPHTIDKAVVTGEDGEDCVIYNQKSSTEYVFYSYNHSGTQGDVGRHTVNTSTFDDDYLSTVPTGAFTLTGGVPHPLCVGGDDELYIGNGNLVSRLGSTGGTTATSAALTLPYGFIIQAMAWNNDRLYIVANRTNSTSVVNQESIIFVWDGIQARQLYDYRFEGRITALLSDNDIIWFWRVSNTRISILGYIKGNNVSELGYKANFEPEYYSITKFDQFITWKGRSDGKIWIYGSLDPEIKPVISQPITHSGGGLWMNNGSLISAGTTGVSYHRGAGYVTTSYYETLMFDASNEDQISVLDKIIVFVKGLNATNILTGARVDMTVKYYDQNGVIQTGAAPNPNAGVISFANDGAIGRKVFHDVNIRCQKWGLVFDWANASTTNPINIEKVIVKGHYVDYH